MKRICAALAAAVLLAALLVPLAATATGDTIYFTAVNDTLLPLSAESMPVYERGVLYVPYTVFDSSVTGVNLGVYYGQEQNVEQTLTLYTRQKMLIFNITRGIAVNQNGEEQGYSAVVRHGKVYVPVRRVCAFFGLDYSLLYTDYGQLIRIKNQNVSLSDAQFLDAAPASLEYRLEMYYAAQATPSPSPSAAQPSPTPTPAPSDQPSAISVYLAFRCQGEATGELLDALEERNVPALLLFPPDALEEQAEQVRRAAASGHSVGFTLTGVEPSRQAEVLEEANRLLADICCARARIVELTDGDRQSRAALEAAGWAVWQSNVSGTSLPGNRAAAANTLYQRITAYDRTARVTLTDSLLIAEALPRLLVQLDGGGHTLRLATEANL